MWRSSKGFFQVEVAMVLLIIFFIINMGILEYRNYAATLDYSYTYVKLKNDAEDICFLLSQTEGVPNNWTANSFKIPGLLNFSGMIDFGKIGNLSASDYVYTINSFNVSSFYLSIVNVSSGDVILSYGILPNTTEYESFVCYGNLAGSIVRISVRTW